MLKGIERLFIIDDLLSREFKKVVIEEVSEVPQYLQRIPDFIICIAKDIEAAKDLYLKWDHDIYSLDYRAVPGFEKPVRVLAAF